LPEGQFHETVPKQGFWFCRVREVHASATVHPGGCDSKGSGWSMQHHLHPAPKDFGPRPCPQSQSGEPSHIDITPDPTPPHPTPPHPTPPHPTPPPLPPPYPTFHLTSPRPTSHLSPPHRTVPTTSTEKSQQVACSQDMVGLFCGYSPLPTDRTGLVGTPDSFSNLSGRWSRWGSALRHSKAMTMHQQRYSL
jgi:hypothetical protein